MNGRARIERHRDFPIVKMATSLSAYKRDYCEKNDYRPGKMIPKCCDKQIRRHFAGNIITHACGHADAHEDTPLERAHVRARCVLHTDARTEAETH